MKTNEIKLIYEEELLKKVEEGVSKKTIWQKPLLLLTQDGDDYNYINDLLRDTYRNSCIVNEPFYNKFVRVDYKIQMSFNDEIVDYNQPDVDLYKYLGGALAYDKKVHRYCVDLVKYEAKPVISIICVTDKNCSVKSIPTWMKEELEIAMLELPYNGIIKNLKANPIFRMSLGSKELFHSNFLEYLWYVDKDAFIEMINDCLPVEKKLTNNDYQLGREKENFDLCIFHEEDGKDIYDLVVENKVKSMPYKEQLKEYVDKARKKNSNGCRFVLLTLTKDFPDKGDDEIEKNWSIVGYDSLKDGIRTHFLNSRIQLANNESYIRDYYRFVEQLIELKKTIISTNDILNSRLFEKSAINSLKEIRLHDLYIKLRCSWFALTFRKTLIEKGVNSKDIHIINKYDEREHGINLNVTINQGNGQIAAWVCDGSEDEKGKGNTFEVVIQGDQYRHGINQNSVEIGGNDKFEKLNSCYKNLLDHEEAKNFLDFGDFSSFDKDVYPAKADKFRKTKKDEQPHDKEGPFCCYGEYYIYRYKNIENEGTIGKLLEIMADDVLRLFSSIPKLE